MILFHTNQPLNTSFQIKKVPISSHESALIRNFLRNERMRGNPIGRVRVNKYQLCKILPFFTKIVLKSCVFILVLTKFWFEFFFEVFFGFAEVPSKRSL